MARVDLIIPTFNGTELLLACLTSLMKSTFTDFNLIVVDDGSSIPVATDVRSLYSNAAVIRFDRNQGLTTVFNAGIASSDAEYVVLLNNDTEVEPDWLAELVNCADRHPEAGSIASKLKLASDRSKLHSAGDTFSVQGMPGNRGVWLPDTGQYDLEEEVFSACAGAALYRRSALESVRLPNGDWFDTRLFMYCEDVDLGWRLQLAAQRCIYCPSAVVYHHLSATGGGTLASYYVARNIWLVLANSVPAGFWDEHRLRIIAYQAGRFLRNLKHIRQPAARKSVIGAVAGINWFVRHRAAPRQVSPAEHLRIRQMLVGDRAI